MVIGLPPFSINVGGAGRALVAAQDVGDLTEGWSKPAGMAQVAPKYDQTTDSHTAAVAFIEGLHVYEHGRGVFVKLPFTSCRGKVCGYWT